MQNNPRTRDTGSFCPCDPLPQVPYPVEHVVEKVVEIPEVRVVEKIVRVPVEKVVEKVVTVCPDVCRG